MRSSQLVSETRSRSPNFFNNILMNNLTQQFILEQGNTFAEAINDGILEQCNQFMISFLNLPTTYVDGNGDTYPTGFNQSYAWTLDAGYILQTNSSIDNGTIVHEMSIYKKTLSKYFKIKTTYSTNCEPCEAPVVRPQPQNTVAVPLDTPPTSPTESFAGGDGTPKTTTEASSN